MPWAWGINGCASVVGAVLASILAMHLGLAIVVCLALALYAVGAAVFVPASGFRLLQERRRPADRSGDAKGR
ncbi:MAG: hypothetical protein ACRC67_37600 [Inquilinus sp.]|uniref:hypothetical protein n=1 Tax=Inquilinus sp. TaxID=1932117 RepID=UPI003F393E00